MYIYIYWDMPGPCPIPGRGGLAHAPDRAAGRPMPRPMCWALSEGPLRAPPLPAPWTGAPRPPHMGRGMGRPAWPGPGHGMGISKCNLARNRARNRARKRRPTAQERARKVKNTPQQIVIIDKKNKRSKNIRTICLLKSFFILI